MYLHACTREPFWTEALRLRKRSVSSLLVETKHCYHYINTSGSWVSFKLDYNTWWTCMRKSSNRTLTPIQYKLCLAFCRWRASDLLYWCKYGSWCSANSPVPGVWFSVQLFSVFLWWLRVIPVSLNAYDVTLSAYIWHSLMLYISHPLLVVHRSFMVSLLSRSRVRLKHFVMCVLIKKGWKQII